jgi:hypothetical protein
VWSVLGASVLLTLMDLNDGRFFWDYLCYLKWRSRRKEGDEMTVFKVETMSQKQKSERSIWLLRTLKTVLLQGVSS